MSSNESARVTIRLPEESLARLREELDNFNTETARFQYLVQLYFDWKEVGQGIPAYEPEENGCRIGVDGTHGAGGCGPG